MLQGPAGTIKSLQTKNSRQVACCVIVWLIPTLWVFLCNCCTMTGRAQLWAIADASTACAGVCMRKPCVEQPCALGGRCAGLSCLLAHAMLQDNSMRRPLIACMLTSSIMGGTWAAMPLLTRLGTSCCICSPTQSLTYTHIQTPVMHHLIQLLCTSSCAGAQLLVAPMTQLPCGMPYPAVVLSCTDLAALKGVEGWQSRLRSCQRLLVLHLAQLQRQTLQDRKADAEQQRHAGQHQQHVCWRLLVYH